MGCDSSSRRISTPSSLFQSTHPRGVRQATNRMDSKPYMVSIHAPAWGATLLRQLLDVGEVVSIHAPAWGATRWACGHFRAKAWFQSTHPRGVRRTGGNTMRVGRPVSIHAPAWGATSLSLNTIYLPFCFNPRTRVGCDSVRVSAMPRVCAFQSTHPRGVRRRPAVHGLRGIAVSIHAPAWGATTGGKFFPDFLPVSIHAPAWGATAKAETLSNKG